MGADMCLTWVIKKGKEEMESRKNKMIDYVKDMKEEELNYYYDEKDDDYPETLEEKRQKHIEIINNFFNSIDNRDMASISHKGEIIYISGGMSWGDMPTDASEILQEFNYLSLKLLKVGGFE